MSERERNGRERHEPRERIRDLVERRLDGRELQALQSGEKEPGRFERYRAVLQQELPGPERILRPIHEHLSGVAQDGRSIARTSCGVELGDRRENRRLRGLIRVRRTRQDLLGISADNVAIDPSVVELRECVGPGCGAPLDVDAVPRHDPIERQSFPDLRSFHEDWLGSSLPVDCGVFEDRWLELIRAWAAGAPGAGSGRPREGEGGLE